jgi:hypothetical protein
MSFGAVRNGFYMTALLLALCQRASALTLAELKADDRLTPERLIKRFAGFKFQLGRNVQQPEEFLKNGSGDCDDFATLAADVLRRKGYSTRLVVVYLSAEAHVVCFVAEAGGYLDYNRRNEASPIVKCDPTLAAIGESVAASFRARWRSASEFSFEDGAKRFVETEFR